jgi:hypothetical protein
VRSLFEVLNLVDHLVPIMITVGVFAVVLVFYIGRPYLRHVALVASANNIDGEIRLARHLANQAGGKRIEVSELWPDFIPAARSLHANHVTKRDGEVSNVDVFGL